MKLRFPVDSSAATDRLIDRAARDGLLDVAYAPVDTPFGRYIIASTRKGLVRLAFDDEREETVVEQLASRISPRVLRAPAELDAVRRQLDEYFAGRRTKFDLAIDWQLSTGFARRVLQACWKIPYGRVSSYREMATKAGNERATRAAGNALGGNPIPIVVPCHRVLRTGGNLGGYGGGLPMKERLLRMEGVLE